MQTIPQAGHLQYVSYFNQHWLSQDPIVSIVMTYYNRKIQTLQTLESFNKYNVPFEVIIIDDGSSESINEYINSFDFSICYIKINPITKTYKNPCVPYNIGFRISNSNTIIIQNSECYHYDDIISRINKYDLDSEYVTFSCYSLTELQSIELKDKYQFKNKFAQFDGDEGWYNHKLFRPSFYHFCSVISRSNLRLLNGFDERFKSGVGYDDDEFLYRVSKKLKIIIDDAIVLHQWHYSGKRANISFNVMRNRLLFSLVTKRKIPFLIFKIFVNKITYKIGMIDLVLKIKHLLK